MSSEAAVLEADGIEASVRHLHYKTRESPTVRVHTTTTEPRNPVLIFAVRSAMSSSAPPHPHPPGALGLSTDGEGSFHFLCAPRASQSEARSSSSLASGSPLSSKDPTSLRWRRVCGSVCISTLAALALTSGRTQLLPFLVTPWLWTSSHGPQFPCLLSGYVSGAQLGSA